MAKKRFIVCMRDDSIRLIGPFDSSADLVAWVDAGNNPSDDLRWQGVKLDTNNFGIEGPNSRVHYLKVYCYAPSAGPMPA